MDFDLTKENIQPLRGGRNVHQLGIALQAQTNREYYLELEQQRLQYEYLIQTYDGDDPLDLYYQYISWMEQSYPSGGHESNLYSFLEHCLAKFENWPCYSNDIRFCKLWIKYIDQQTNPLELYHMMYAKRLCFACTELYKAWAYYHEAMGDFANAHNVFEFGKKELAQPYEDLEAAHKNLFLSAGEHTIHGPDVNRLQEKRKALTSLHTYRPGLVNNVRVPSITNHPTINYSATRSNTAPVIPIYDNSDETPGLSAGIGPNSIITAAKRQEMPKENLQKAGPWNTNAGGGKSTTKTPILASFAVHVDDDSDDYDVMGGLCLPTGFVCETLETTYENWNVKLTLAEPMNSRVKQMYPKERVYKDPNVEYSLEELRAERYMNRKSRSFEVEHMQTTLSETQTMKNESSYINCRTQSEDCAGAVVPQQSNTFLNISQHSAVQYNDPIIVQPAIATTPIIPHRTNKLLNVWNESGHCSTPSSDTKGSAIKSLNADDLVETGSRGGMDIAATAQPADSAKPMAYNSEDSSTFDDEGSMSEKRPSLDNSMNTEHFFFNVNNLKTMNLSTPQGKYSLPAATSSPVLLPQTGAIKKQLFVEPPAVEVLQPRNEYLSTIMEEKTFSSTSGSSGCNTKSLSNVVGARQMVTISEEHNSYLAQNLMANAELRSSLLGDLMDYDHSGMIEPKVLVRQAVKPLSAAPSDPFRTSTIEKLLQHVGFPGPHFASWIYMGGNLRIKVRKEPVCLVLGQDKYFVEKQLGKGTFGTVFKALRVFNNKHVALKYQKQPNKWEFYICKELQARLADNPYQDRFMDVFFGYYSDQFSVLVSAFMPYGSLLDIANLVKLKQGKVMKESLCIYFAIEMLQIINVMHSVKIIHADIKPDNFLAFLLPNNQIGLQLIDFGCSIDMSLFPADTMFTRLISTEDFTCCEMRDGRPWSYHTDFFCVAATTHVLLFDKYIQMRQHGDLWSITTVLPRYARKDVWNLFFDCLLNQQNGPADTEMLQLQLSTTLSEMANQFGAEMRAIVNLLKNR